MALLPKKVPDSCLTKYLSIYFVQQPNYCVKLESYFKPAETKMQSLFQSGEKSDALIACNSQFYLLQPA